MKFPAPIGLGKRLFSGNSEVPVAPDSGNSAGTPLARVLQTFVNTLTSEERKAMLKAHPELLSSQADKILAHSASLAPNERDRQRLQQCRAFLDLCRKIGIDAAFTPVPETPPGTPLGFVLQAFINAPTLGQKKAIIQAHPELLSPNLEALLPRADDDRTQKVLEQYRRLLELCRQAGIDAAFAELERQTRRPALAAASLPALSEAFNELIRKFEAGNAAAEVASEAIALIPDLPRVPRTACTLLAMVSSVHAGHYAQARQLAKWLDRQASGTDLPGLPSRAIGPAVVESVDTGSILEALGCLEGDHEATADEQAAIASLIAQYTERKKTGFARKVPKET